MAQALRAAMEMDGSVAGTALVPMDGRGREGRRLYSTDKDYVRPYPARDRQPERFKGAITAEGLGLAGADARTGLAQWAARASLAMFYPGATPQMRSIALEGGGKAATGVQDWIREDWSMGRAQLAQALGSFCKALKKAELAFAGAALDKVELDERAWLVKQGLDKAVDQAAAAGALTSKAIAWAVVNPVSASLHSADPVARMAAKMSRALGLRPGGDQEMVDALHAELADMGASAGALELLSRSEGLRSHMEALAKYAMGREPGAGPHATRLMAMAMKAASAAAEVGLPEADAAAFVKALSGEDKFGGGAEPMEPSLPSLALATAKAARMVVEIAEAKRARQPGLYRALAKDWEQSLGMAGSPGIDAEGARALAEARISSIAQGLSRRMELDWRRVDFDAQPAWSVFGIPSHRMQAAMESARAQEGLGRWCARHARSLGVHDAADANDLIGKCRDAAKARCAMGDGAWKMAAKSAAGLEMLAKAAGLSAEERASTPRSAGLRDEARLGASDRAELGKDSEGVEGVGSEAARVGYAMSLAAAQGADPVSAVEATHALRERCGSHKLFGMGIARREVEGEAGAAFFLAEAEAKSSRMPKIFQEACKRHAKFAQDRSKSLARGDAEPCLPAGERIAGEIADLVGWIDPAEHGVWQTLPADPTWGQLQRLSKAWHDEQAARAADQAAREEAARAEQAAADALNPFAPNSGERWGLVMERHARDGWEAVELASAKDLMEEGTAMSHCVSGYAPKCRSGEVRIFSVRLNGERKCTMEISAGSALRSLGADAKFKISQNKGKHNAAVVNPAARDFCEEALAKFKQAWIRRCEELDQLKERDKEAKAKAAQDKKQAEALAKGEGGEVSAPAKPKRGAHA